MLGWLGRFPEEQRQLFEVVRRRHLGHGIRGDRSSPEERKLAVSKATVETFTPRLCTGSFLGSPGLPHH